MFKVFGSTDIKEAVRDFFSGEDLSGMHAIDVPAGEGVTTEILRSRGAKVTSVDLFPGFFKATGECLRGNLSQALPLESSQADLLVCQEGLEHLPDQLKALGEFHRVLKPAGRLFITIPNGSHFLARLSYFLNESEIYKRLPPNELDDVWHARGAEVYFGHIFYLGIQRLRTLARISGFELVAFHPVKISLTSCLIGILGYPFVAIFSLWAFLRNRQKQKAFDRQVKDAIYGEILKLNLHPAVLFGRHLFVEFRRSERELTLPRPSQRNVFAPSPVSNPAPGGGTLH